MREVRHGRSAAFAELVQRYHSPLLRVARSRLACGHRAEDVVQDTFLAAFKGRHTFKPAARFTTWLWTIFFNECRRAWHADQRHKRHLADGDQQAAECLAADTAGRTGHGSPLEQLLAAERQAVLDSLLTALPEVQADALRLRFFGQLKFQEIADIMGCSLGTAKNRVRAGLLRLAAALETAGSASPPSGPPD